jgi:hypothetical protein
MALLVAAIAALLVVSGCASDDSVEPNTVEGIVTEVTGDLTAVESLVIMDSEGRATFSGRRPDFCSTVVRCHTFEITSSPASALS